MNPKVVYPYIKWILYLAIMILACACFKAIPTATGIESQTVQITIIPSAATNISRSMMAKTPERTKTSKPLATRTISAAVPPFNFYENLQPGQYIVYSSLDATTENPTTASLKVISPDGQISQTITELEYGANYLVKISPDLQQVAFMQDLLPHQGVFIKDLSTGKITKVPEVESCMDLDWSPDSTKLAIASDKIYIFSLSEKKIDLLPMQIPRELLSFEAIAWSPDGKWIIARSAYDNLWNRDTGGGLYLIDTACLSDIATCQGKTRLLDKVRSEFYSPTCSPTSRSLAAFITPGVIGIWDIQEKASRRVSIPDWKNSTMLIEWGYLAWSPDGNWFAYSQADIPQEVDQNTDINLFVMPVNGGKPKLVLDNADIKLVMGWVTIP